LEYSVLSQNIKKYRNMAKLTQKELGEKIYKSEILIRKYESGKVNIPVSTLLDICNVLKVSASTLLSSDIKQYISENMKNLIDENMITENGDMPMLFQRYENNIDSIKNTVRSLQDNAISWRDAVFKIEEKPNYLLNAILNYLENTEQYYSPLNVSTEIPQDPELKYFTDKQIRDIINKISELVKYEIYKIENNIK